MIHEIKYYLRTVGYQGLLRALSGKVKKRSAFFKLQRSDVKYPFFVRVPSSDVPTYDQVFFSQEYSFNVDHAPKTIIDAGANIGLASIYFANRFPDATIIAIEPEESNLEVLRQNIEPYKNIILIPGALWNENTVINLVDPGCGKWGFITKGKSEVDGRYGDFIHEVKGMTIDTIMREQGIDHIDILKIDIEGAEREVFKDTSSWIDKVDNLIVELHENTNPGCNCSFYRGTTGFDIEWTQGENVYLSRKTGCIMSPNYK